MRGSNVPVQRSCRKLPTLIMLTGIAIMGLGTGSGCEPSYSPDAFVGTFADSPSGPIILEITKSGDHYQGVVTTPYERRQVNLKVDKAGLSEKFFTHTQPGYWAGLESEDTVLSLVHAPVESDIGGHKMTTEYLLHIRGLGFTDLHKK